MICFISPGRCHDSTVKCEVDHQAQLNVITQNQQTISLKLITVPLNCHLHPDMNNSTFINKDFSIITACNNIHIPDTHCLFLQVSRIQKGGYRVDSLQSLSIFLCDPLACEFSSPHTLNTVQYPTGVLISP